MGICKYQGSKKDWDVLKKFYDYLYENYPEFNQTISKTGKCTIEYKPENVYSFYDVMLLEGRNWSNSIFSTIFEEDYAMLGDEYESRTSAMKEMVILYPIYVMGDTVLRKDEVREFFSDYYQEIRIIELSKLLAYKYDMVKNIAETQISVFNDNSPEADTIMFSVVNRYEEDKEDYPEIPKFITRADGRYWSQELKFSISASNMLKTIINCFRLVDDKSVVHIYNEGENPVAKVYGVATSKYKYGDNVTVDKFLRDLIYYIRDHCNKPIKELYVLGKDYTKFRVRKNFDEEYTMTIY